jgi:hypothetical protein
LGVKVAGYGEGSLMDNFGLTKKDIDQMRKMDRAKLKEAFVETAIELGAQGVLKPNEVKDIVNNIDYYLKLLLEAH